MDPSPTTPPRPKPGAELVARLDAATGRRTHLATDLKDSVATNTWKSYRSDLSDYGTWCDAKKLPWDHHETIADYFRALEDSGAAYATIDRRKTAIAKLVAAEQILTGTTTADPTKHPEISITLKAIRRRIGTDRVQSLPLTGDRMIQLLLAIDADKLAGQRDVALLLIGFYGAFRRSELAGMRRDHFRFEDHGVAIRLPTSKASQEAGVWVPIARHPTSRWDPVAALEAWLAAIDLHRGEDRTDGIWLRINKGDNFHRPLTPIKSNAINDLVQRRAKTGALPTGSTHDHNDNGAVPDDPEIRRTYTAHSLRAGAVTELKNRGVDEGRIMQHTRYESIEIMRGYDREAGWWRHNPTTDLSL